MDGKIVTNTSSHGTEVASVAAAPANNAQGLAGIAPGANVLPIRVEPQSNASIERAIYEASYDSSVDVINLSLASSFCPSTYITHSLRAATIYAVTTQNKVVVWAAGNGNADINSCSIAPPCVGCPEPDPSGGGIIVGGTANDTTSGRVKGWVTGPGDGSNYYTSNASNKVIHMAAAAYDIDRIAGYDPSTGNHYSVGAGITNRGTSLAAPMVSAAAGMMRRLAVANSGSLSALQTRSMLINSADLVRYTGGYTSTAESQFLGDNLHNQYDSTYKPVGVRSLNLFNALTLAKYSHQYQTVARMTNTDDDVYATINWDWPTHQYAVENFGDNAFWGINGLTSGDKLAFYTYNSSYGGYAYGYQVYRNSVLATNGEQFRGVSGVTGAENNAAKAVGWYGPWDYTY